VDKWPYHCKFTTTQNATTFSFVARFNDKNINQVFKIDYTKKSDGQSYSYQPSFSKIKSLWFSTSCTTIPSQSNAIFPLCQETTIPVTFTNISWGIYPDVNNCFGSITKYEYLVPAGWKVGTTLSDGTTWIPGNNSTTVTSDLTSGDGQYIQFRPATTDCAAGLENHTVPGTIKIVRSNPTLSISGTTDYICSGTASYTVSGVPAGSTVTWSSNYPTDAALSCSNGDCSIVNVTRSTAYNREVLLTANVAACSGNYTATHTIHLGKPFYTNTGYEIQGVSHPIKLWTGSTSDYNQICMNYTATTQFSFSGSQSVTWSRTYASPSSVTWNQSGDNISTYFFATGQYERFSLTATNVCGTLSDNYGFSSKDCSGGGGGGCLYYQVSPNPASNTLQVGTVTPNIPAPCDPLPTSVQSTSTTSLKTATTTDRSIQSVSIYDNKGILKMQRKYGATNKHATLNVSKLPAGVYFVRITDGNYTENHQVIIGK
jgi:hypothetical protein